MSKEKLSRRDFIRLGVVGLGCAGVGYVMGQGSGLRGAGKVEAAEKTEGKEFAIGNVRIFNLKDVVPADQVDIAKGSFQSVSGVASFIFAEPGGLLVGPDFGDPGPANPFGANPGGWETMYNSGGSIRPFSPVSQEVAHYDPPFSQNLPEGGFDVITAGMVKAEIGGIKIEADFEAGNTYILAIRGFYPDGKQDSDLNRTLKLVDYQPGHLLSEMFESRQQTNLAFISEGWLAQKVATSHHGGTNCGAEGCSKVTLVALDTNTQALEIWENRQAGNLNLQEAIEAAKESGNWQLLFSNFESNAGSF